jgi:hypothetical protein
MAYAIIPITKAVAQTVCGSVTSTSKMPCDSYSLPTVSCITGFRMSKIAGSVCSHCYADKGFYAMYANNVQPAQHARLDSVWRAMDNEEAAQLWISAIVALIGNQTAFRWHDSGDLQGIQHLRLICIVCEATPNTMHWLPTREYSQVKDYIAQYGALPDNLTIRLSAMYPDKPVIIPLSLQGIAGIETSNVHKNNAPIGQVCNAPNNGGKCGDCRLCFTRSGPVSYEMH